VLREALTKTPSAEARRRIERVLELAGPATPERRREVRAVETLERLGSPEAQRLLSSLAGGAEGALLTREARSSTERITGK
jgi:hypothetical protein